VGAKEWRVLKAKLCCLASRLCAAGKHLQQARRAGACPKDPSKSQTEENLLIEKRFDLNLKCEAASFAQFSSIASAMASRCT